MQDHGGVVTQENDEEVENITCKSGRERIQVGVPDNEMCNVLNTPWRDYVWAESQGIPQGLLEAKLSQLFMQEEYS